MCQGKLIFVFSSQTSTGTPERLFLVLQYQGNANISVVSKILSLYFVECQTRLTVSSHLKTCDFALCLNLETFISKA